MGYPRREARGQTRPQSGHCRWAAPPPPGAHPHGNAGLRLSPPPGARRQEAVRAEGFWETAVSGVSASAVDSEGAVVPEPEVCARAGERASGGRRARGCGHLAGPLGETFFGSSGGAGDRPLSPRPAAAARGALGERPCRLSAPSAGSSPVSSATLAFPLPHRPVLFYFQAPASRGEFWDSVRAEVGKGRPRARAAGTCSSAGRGRKCGGPDADVPEWPWVL